MKVTSPARAVTSSYVNPVVAVLLGVVILGEHLVVRGVGAVILALAVGAMTAATIALGRDSSLQAAS